MVLDIVPMCAKHDIAGGTRGSFNIVETIWINRKVEKSLGVKGYENPTDYVMKRLCLKNTICILKKMTSLSLERELNIAPTCAPSIGLWINDPSRPERRQW